jgi:hypothetical protein
MTIELSRARADSADCRSWGECPAIAGRDTGRSPAAILIFDHPLARR